jgi:hypothetical protein
MAFVLVRGFSRHFAKDCGFFESSDHETFRQREKLRAK